MYPILHATPYRNGLLKQSGKFNPLRFRSLGKLGVKDIVGHDLPSIRDAPPSGEAHVDAPE